MKNYKLEYKYDGNIFWDIVAAETPTQAITWLQNKDNGIEVIGISETNDEPSYIATEITKTPFWLEFGATSEEEWIAYTNYYNALVQIAYAKYSQEHPDEDPEDFKYEVNALPFKEWKASPLTDQHFDVFETGKCYSQFCTGSDAYRIEYSSVSGFSLYITMYNPSDYEQKQMFTSSHFCTKFSVLSDVCFFSFKFGNLPWGDAPFSPCIYENPIHFENDFSDNVGLALNVFLFDSANGKLLYVRQIGLGHDFSNSWIDWCKKANRNLTIQEYHQIVQKVFDDYPSDELALRAEHSYEIKGDKL